MRRLLLISNSTLHGSGYLDHCKDQIKSFLTDKVKTVLFVPYALHDRDQYASIARTAYNSIGFNLESIHEKPNAVDAVRQAEAIFIGGGNTFRLLKTLYDENIVDEIRKRVFEDSMPYIGSSAGSNVATVSINTTNDMPIVYPPSFKALGLVPFNINAHYQDPDPNSKHMGETREQRINQYHEYEDSPSVLGIREGCILHVEGDKATLKGVTNARLFEREKEPVEYDSGSDMSFLLKV
ncbi:alpha-aspartyl dipeptidase-like isoform X2 [Ruditapes philippinarum]|uniref:alpha-aspartyl dipeptidase-like isoform X2 n=1 Tax=Ruditapes philippinarum TaxID=129788 RepID=UPI00295AB7F6|nr:alpha-aspartyl dipeptidase-like isoform X2 [Ruditapes philippinarum]